MIPFEYVRATTSDDARARLASGGKYLAGGTTLVDLMKLEVETPSLLVDVNALPLGEIHFDDDGTVHVGAAVKNSTLAHHPRVASDLPLLSKALLSGASPQLRNVASVAGNLLQRTRCPYFRDPALPCNKRVPHSGCAAREGYNRSHAILGTSAQCIATHPSDMCVALMALGALIHVAGKAPVPMADFYLEPGDTPERENVLDAGDLITGVEIPALPFARRSTYLKVRDRASYEFALTSAAVALDVHEGVVRGARIALGGVGTKPWRAHAAERSLIGALAGREAYRAAARAELAPAVVHEHNAFKVQLCEATLIRALEEAEALS